MRAFLTSAVLTVATVATVAISAAPAHAQPGGYAGLVDGWYHRYLGRHVDPIGIRDHVHALRHGTPIDFVEAAILSSPEYYVRNGNTPEGYIAALHRDVLGRRAGPIEFNHEVNYMLTHGRHAAALHVLRERAASVAPVVVVSPPIVVARPAPVVVHRPVVVDPVVVVPRHHHVAPVYVAPPPGISIRIGIR